MARALNLLAEGVLKSTEPSVQSHLQLADSCARTAACETLDLRSRVFYRVEQGKHILTAVSLHSSTATLSSETMLRVAGLIAHLRSK
jgi:hypothetical protein